jgi:hypothetical protein
MGILVPFCPDELWRWSSGRGYVTTQTALFYQAFFTSPCRLCQPNPTICARDTTRNNSEAFEYEVAGFLYRKVAHLHGASEGCVPIGSSPRNSQNRLRARSKPPDAALARWQALKRRAGWALCVTALRRYVPSFAIGYGGDH